MPVTTRRSSVRGTPRGLFGNKGSLTLGSTPVGPWRLVDKLPQFESLPEQLIAPLENYLTGKEP